MGGKGGSESAGLRSTPHSSSGQTHRLGSRSPAGWEKVGHCWYAQLWFELLLSVSCDVNIMKDVTASFGALLVHHSQLLSSISHQAHTILVPKEKRE